MAIKNGAKFFSVTLHAVFITSDKTLYFVILFVTLGFDVKC